MIEAYCTDIEELIRGGFLRDAVRSSIAVPEICAALEDTAMQYAPDRYVAWCRQWLTNHDLRRLTSLAPERILRFHQRRQHSVHSVIAPALVRLRMRRYARPRWTPEREWGRVPETSLGRYQVVLCEVLIAGARTWYRIAGRTSTVVQENLARLTVMS